MTPVLRLPFALTALLALAAPAAFGEPLTVQSLAERILASDPSVQIADQTLRLARAGYRGTVALAKPQVSVTTGYGLQYSPSTVIALPPMYNQIEYEDKSSQRLTASVSVSQLLPTGGTAILSAENAFGAETGKIVSGGTVTARDPQYTQAPKVGVSLTQPVFLNRKLLDLRLFPATLRKARIGYLKEESANIEARNQALVQGLELYCSVQELRRGIAALESGLELAAGRLRNVEQSYRLGAAAETDVWELRIAVGRQQESLLELRYRLAQAEASLARSIGSDTLAGFSLEGEVPALDFTLEAGEALAEAQERHPLIVQNSLGAEEKSLELVLGGQQHASSLTLGFSVSPQYSYGYTGAPDIGSSIADLFGPEAGVDYSLSLGLRIPVYEGGKRAADREGQLAAELIARQSLAVRRRLVSQDVQTLLLRRQNLASKVELLEDNTELLRRRLEVEQGLLALGKSTELDVLARRVELESKRNEAWRAQADLYLAVLALYRAVGRDLAEIIKDQQG